MTEGTLGDMYGLRQSNYKIFNIENLAGKRRHKWSLEEPDLFNAEPTASETLWRRLSDAR